MATIDDILKKYQKALTKKQIEDLVQKSEQYKLLNAGNRANAQTQLAKQYRQTRRGLQNVGLAGREGKLISGREISVKDAYRNAYGTYNAQLQQSENAMIEQAAAKKAAANARARQQQAEQQQKAIEYEQERFNQEQITDPRLDREKPTREDKEYSALVNYNPFNHTADENVNYYLKIAERNGMKGVEANRYAMSMSAEVANRKGAAAEAIQPHGLQPNQEQIQKNLPSLRFAQDYGVNLMKLKQEDPAMAQTIEDDVKYWYDFIDEKSEFWSNAIRNKTKDYHAAMQMQANAYAALAKLSLASKAPAEQRKYYLMSDAEFDTAYDATERAYTRAEQEYQIAKKDSSGEMDDVISEPKAALEKAMQMKNLMDQIKANRASNSTVNLLAYQMQIPESAKTKDKEYASTKEYVDENQNDWKKNEQETDAPGTPTGRLTVKTYLDPTNTRPSWNWSYAREIGWSADDYSKNHDTKGSRYAALINEWSLINGRTAALYGIGQYGDIDSGLSGVFDAIQAIFGANRADTNVDYKWFRDECLMSMRGNYDDTGSSAQKEQMDAMLTLANLMTDEERARFNALLETMGARAADEYFDLLYKTVLPERFSAYVADNNVSEINSLPRGTRWTASGASVPQSISQGIPGIVNAYKTNQQDPVAARVSAMRYNNAQIIRNARMQNFGKFGQFAYSTGMSMADSATVALISGGIGKALEGVGVGAELAGKIGSTIGGSLLGASAYNSTYQEGLERGLTPEKARMTALGAGINEMLFESLSLDLVVGHYQKGGILKVSKKAWVNWIVNTLVQGGVEGSEEVFTDIGNNIWDKMVNGIYSEELTKIREYVSQGMTLEEAKRKVSGEFAAQLGMSFAGGFASGGVMGGGSTFMGMLQNIDVAKIGSNLDENAKAEIREYDFKNEEAKEILTGKLTDEDYGRLAMTRLEEMAQTDPIAAEKAAQSLIDATARTDVKVDKRNQTLKTGTDNTVSFNYDGVTDVKKMSGVQVEALRFAQTLVKSKVGGVNINVANQLFDKNGNEQNGWYDAKTNTVHVSLNGSQSVVYTISHELTHRLKRGNEEAYASMRDAMKSELESLDLTGSDLPGEYENILGDYLVKDGEQRTAWEALIEYEMDRYKKHGITLDRESAEEEVVCRACETMLERSRLISSMISKNVRSAKTIAKFLASIYDDIASLKAEAESRGYEDGSPEKLFIDQYTDVEKIANAWASAMKTVSQDTTKKIVKEEGRGGTAFSLKQELRDDGQSLADKSMKYRKAHKAESQHISDEMLEAANKQIHRMAQRMLPFLTLKNKKGMTYLPDEVLGKTRFGNSSYGGTSIENTTICFRTLAYIDFTNEIKKQIGRPLTVEESFLASQMLYQIAKEPQCLYCYVSLDRKAYDEQLLSYIKQRDKVVKGYNKLSLDERQAITKATRNASKSFTADIPLYTEFLAGRKDTVPMRTRFAQWIDIANSGSEAITAADLATDERRGLMRNGDDWKESKRTAGKVSLQDQVIDAERYAQGASWAKKMEEYRAYNGDILKIGKRTVNKLNNEYGLRFYSFSEYSPAFIVENMQQIRDAALKGLMGLAYTKKTDFARIFAGTGMNINVSTFGRWGVDADGNRVVVMDSDQGADWTEVQNLRKQYENVGAVFVATDDAMTEWAIKQDWIDVVIPFHIVRTGANVAEFYKWVVHNSEQNDVTAEGKNATIPAAEHGNSYEKYMSLVNERGLTPRFDKWRPENNPNVTADEYMKLVNETRRTLDATKPLQPIYDTREAAKSFAAFVHDGGYYGDYYKAKSEQDIKVPISPAQDILGIGSKTYTEQEGIDRVVADIKAGNKANQVPYGRQDIDEQISRLNKARQVKQHGQKFSIKEGEKLSVAPVSDAVSSETNVKFSIREEAAPTKTQDVYKLMRLGKDGRLYPLFIDSAEGIDLGVWYNADSPDMSVLKTLPSGVYLIGDDGKDIVSLADYQRTHGEKSSKFPSKAAINSAANDGKRWVFIEDVAKAQRRYGGENRKYWNLGINGSGSVSTFAMRPGWHAGSLPTMRQIGKGANRNLRDDTFVWVKGRVSADVDYQAEASQNPDNDIPTHIPTNGFYMKATNPNATAAQTDAVGWYIAGAFIADKIMSDSEARNVIDDWNASHPSDHVEYDWERESGGEFDAETMSIRNAKYSLKDTVEGESLGKDYLKYLQLGTKVVNQTATEDEIRDFKRRMNELSEDNRMGFLDRLREKLIRDDEGAKVREVRDRQIAALKEELKQARERRSADREARKRDDIKRKIQKGSAKITQMLAHPTEARHVPVPLAKEVIEFMTMLNDFMNATVSKDAAEPMTKRGKAIAEKLKQVYDESFTDQETIKKAQEENPEYNPLGNKINEAFKDIMLSDMIKVVGDVISEKSVDNLTSEELSLINDVLRGVTRTVLDANKLVQSQIKADAQEAGLQMMSELRANKKMNRAIRFYLEESLDLRRIARIFSRSNDDAVFVKLANELNEGAIEKERIAQVLQRIFDPVTEKYGDEIRKWYGKDAEWINTGIEYKGREVRITKGMRVSLALHVLNEGNMKHIKNGGITIPDEQLYKKGHLKEAYADEQGSHLVRLDEEDINKIISDMTDAEKAYLEVAKDFFHNRTGYYINRTSLATVGYRKAMVKNYFPIHTDGMFNIKDLAQYFMQNGSVEGFGFLKDRVSGSNPILLEDITSVINRQIKGVSLYAGLAPAVRNWNAVLNAQEWEQVTEYDKEKKENKKVWRPFSSVEKTMTTVMGEEGVKVVKGFLADVQELNHVDVTPMERFAGKLATNYVKAVLLGNLKVAMKQVASYPTAAAVIPWKYLGKALFKGGRSGRMISRADVDLINQYTPLYQMRREGQANEIASIMAKRGMEQKLPWLLGWITKMDVMTVGRLWSAAEYMVADQQNLPVGSDEYYKAVAKVFNDTIQQTQPNFTPLQRNAALRSKNPVVRSLVLFGTQRMQNGGILIEAAMDLKHSKGKSKAEIQAAKRKLGRAVASQIVQNILLIVASIGVDALRGRMKGWQDDDKEITAESLAKGMGDMFLSNFIGSFLGGSETYSLISGLFKKAMGETAYDTEFTVPALDAVETLINFAQSDVPDAVKYLLGDHTDEEKQKKAINFSYQLAKAFGYATGIPLENALKDVFKGIIPAIEDIRDAVKTGELNPWLHQSGKLDAKTTNANYKEWTSNGFKGSEYFYWENVLSQYGKREEKIPILLDADLPNEKKAMLLRMMDKSGATSEGTVVYKSNGDVLIDFANPTEKQQALPMPTAETDETATPTTTPTATPKPTENPLTDARQEGVREAVAKGVPEQTAFDAFLAYQNMGKNKSDDYSRNDDFRAWLFANVTSPEQRAILEYQVIGTAKKVEGSVTYRDSGVVFRDYTNESWFKLSEHNLSKDGTNKRYEAGKRLEKTGLSVDKTVAIYDALAEYTKKAEWTTYLKEQGLSNDQITIFLWSRGWAKLK